MDRESALCARLCLLTRAAWTADLPAPLSRRALRLLMNGGDTGENARIAARARTLLERAPLVRKCIEAYRAQGYGFLLPQDEAWPARLRRLPEGQQPLFLMTRGEISLLCGRLVAVAGSREIRPHTAALARHTGQLLAAEGMTLVCGGARGVDSAAQRGQLELGGGLVLVPAQPVERLLADEALRNALEARRLLFLCDALPDAPFSAAKALGRNHTIYALGEAAIVVAARDGVGGSWHGAMDCLRAGCTPVFTSEEAGADMQGNGALLSRGARRVDLLRPLKEQLFVHEQMSMF